MAVVNIQQKKKHMTTSENSVVSSRYIRNVLAAQLNINREPNYRSIYVNEGEIIHPEFDSMADVSHHAATLRNLYVKF